MVLEFLNAHVKIDVIRGLFAQLFARLRKPRDAEKVIAEMQNAYLRPNERTYGIVINGFIAAGLIEESLPLLERMKMEGITPTVAVFNHLVKGYAEAMQPEGIEKVKQSQSRCIQASILSLFSVWLSFYSQ